MTSQRRIDLRTGVGLHVVEAGPADGPAVILLHGFPESHRTWREIVPRLADRFRVIAPDLRGFGDSDRPQDVESYATETLVDDVAALSEALGLKDFALVGHDWGGAIAWAAAIGGLAGLRRLAIVNSPHPAIFQKSLIADENQRRASQYITAFRNPGFEQAVAAMGFDTFFDKSFAGHVDPAKIPEAERAKSIAQWSRPGALTAMLNWYRASKMIVPPPGVGIALPDWLLAGFPRIDIPTLVVWGMRDAALLPVQLDGLDDLVTDLTIVRLAEAGHFAPWEQPDRVAEALIAFLEAADREAPAAARP